MPNMSLRISYRHTQTDDVPDDSTIRFLVSMTFPKALVLFYMCCAVLCCSTWYTLFTLPRLAIEVPNYLGSNEYRCHFLANGLFSFGDVVVDEFSEFFFVMIGEIYIAGSDSGSEDYLDLTGRMAGWAVDRATFHRYSEAGLSQTQDSKSLIDDYCKPKQKIKQ
ncbi:hypothetical protein EAF00_002580 [Botryotinia globosa]|nr:hypothetical protein EAF00_002580 [Botryotinia globosa]